MPWCGTPVSRAAGSRSARCATSASTAATGRSRPGSTCPAHAWVRRRHRPCCSCTAAAGCTATWRATTPPAGSWPSAPAYSCWRWTTGSPRSTPSPPRSRTAGRPTAGWSSTPTTVNADPDRLAVGGDSAGGNLAAATAVHAAANGLPLAFQLLVYPGTDFVERAHSRRTLGEGFYLTERFIELAQEAYFGAGATGDESDPDASVLRRAEFPPGLAPAHVVTAGLRPPARRGPGVRRAAAPPRRAASRRRSSPG